jgi:D-tagatose-1,6-bisphosphate aldolase subunit GatZ/KbaZ
VDFDHTRVQHYERAAAEGLSDFVAGQPGLVFEAHSTDYQRESALHAMVRDHFAILKVGPALTFALREALLALSRIEEELVEPAQASGVMAALDDAMLAHPEHWIKHYHGDDRHLRLLRRYGLSDRCRYYWGEPAVATAVATLFANLDDHGIVPALLSQHLPEQHAEVLEGRLVPAAEELVLHKIGRVLAQYARACHRNMAPARDGKPLTIC